MDSMLAFWNQMTANPLLFIAVMLTLGVILVNGWTDAPNAIATCVVTRCMPPKAAILMAAVFNFLGVFVMTLVNAKVAETITKMVDFGTDPDKAIIALSAALFAIVLWATLAWVFGIPTSESHALIAGLTGSAIALHNSLDGVNGGEWVKVVYGIGVSVVLGFGLGWLVCKLVTKIFYKANRPKTEPFFRGAQIAGAAYSAFMHGAQDGQKFMGVVLLCVYMSHGQALPKDLDIANDYLWLMILCSSIMALGTAMGGKKIIKSVGMDMVKLEKYQGFSADLAASTSLLLCSVFSLPVSTTHAKTTAIMGVGAVKRVSAINFSVVKEMVMTWVLTFPGCGLVGFLMTKLFMYIFT
ncbi:MAG: inorganic phosphate transporter [Ruminococcaceae bacterium]|nr:inorganic phosphate transporter [Oscillospiraceae bacterium]